MRVFLKGVFFDSSFLTRLYSKGCSVVIKVSSRFVWHIIDKFSRICLIKLKVTSFLIGKKKSAKKE